jgi:hypothetical protein
MRTGIVLGLLACFASTAAAEEFDHTVQYTHKGQFGLSAQGGLGFRFIAPYDEEYCGQISNDGTGDNKAVCSGLSPITLDLGASYGVSRSLELLLEVRLGLERDFAASEVSADEGPRQIAFAPGLKIYIRDAGLTKFFSSLQVVIDTTDYEQVGGTDFGIRNVNGLQFDFHRTTGVYFYVGETLAFSRWFRFEMDAGVGIQLRVP